MRWIPSHFKCDEHPHFSFNGRVADISCKRVEERKTGSFILFLELDHIILTLICHPNGTKYFKM